MFPTCTHQEKNSRIFMKVSILLQAVWIHWETNIVLLQEAHILRRPGRTAHSFSHLVIGLDFFWEPPLNLSQTVSSSLLVRSPNKAGPKYWLQLHGIFGLKSCPPEHSPIKQRKLEANIQGTDQGIHDHLSRCIGRFGSWEILIWRNLEAKF